LKAKFDELLAILLLMMGREFIKDEWIPCNSDEKLASGTNNIGNDNVPETSVVRILLPGLTTSLLSKYHAHKSKDLGLGAMLRNTMPTRAHWKNPVTATSELLWLHPDEECMAN
jgi:hypothetical protein